MEYEWDWQKNLLNFEKHGLSFEAAPEVFSDVHLTRLDTRFDYGEDRYLTMGLLVRRVVIVAHTIRNGTNRIISMRKANEREQKIYYEAVEKIQ
jgi:hypothetical protein